MVYDYLNLDVSFDELDRMLRFVRRHEGDVFDDTGYLWGWSGLVSRSARGRSWFCSSWVCAVLHAGRVAPDRHSDILRANIWESRNVASWNPNSLYQFWKLDADVLGVNRLPTWRKTFSL